MDGYIDDLIYMVVEMEPKTYEQARRHPDAKHWLEVVDKEYGNLLQNKTWEFIESDKILLGYTIHQLI